MLFGVTNVVKFVVKIAETSFITGVSAFSCIEPVVLRKEFTYSFLLFCNEGNIYENQISDIGER